VLFRSVVNSTETKVCYDLATSMVEVSCSARQRLASTNFKIPVFATNRSANITANSSTNRNSTAVGQAGSDSSVLGPSEGYRCSADLELGISTPYPCPCEVPADEDIFLGFARSADKTSLSDVLGFRSEHEILWRYIAAAMWNFTATTLNSSSQVNSAAMQNIVPSMPTGAWLASLQSAMNVSFFDSAGETERRRQRRSIVQAMRQATERLGDAVTLVMVPGQSDFAVDTSSLSFTSAVSLVSVVPSGKGIAVSTAGNNISRVFMDLGSKARVELDYPSHSFPEISPGNTSTFTVANASHMSGAMSVPAMINAPPSFVPMTGVLWHGNGGPFGWLDSSRRLLSSVVQLRLPGAPTTADAPGQFSRLRFRFQVTLPSGLNCGSPDLSADAVTFCCSGQHRRILQMGSCEVPSPPALPATTPTPAPVLVPLVPMPPSPAAGNLIQVGGNKIPFEGPLTLLYTNSTFWVPVILNATLAGTSLRIRGGDLRMVHICTNSSTARLRLLIGSLMEEPTYEGAICEDIFNTLRVTRFNRMWGLGQKLLEATDLAGVHANRAYSPPSYGTDSDRRSWCNASSVQTQAWCPNGFDNITLPFEAEIEISDPGGVIVLGFSGAQISLEGSLETSLSTPAGSWVSLFAQHDDENVFSKMFSMYSRTITHRKVVATVQSKDDLFRPWRLVGSSTTTTTSGTATSTTASTTTTTDTATTTPLILPAIPPWETPPAVLLRLLEGPLDAYLEILGEALNMDGTSKEIGSSEEEVVYARRMAALRPFAQRTSEITLVLDFWSHTVGSSTDVASVIFAFTPVASLVDLPAARPLEELLLALDGALPANWSDAHWKQNTSASGNDTIAEFAPNMSCESVDCVALSECALGFDASEEFECVAWSPSVMRWVPALGCRIIPPSEILEPMIMGGTTEVVCECERGVLHNAVAIAKKRPPLLPTQGRVRVVTREVFVVWYTKLNRYNSRGLLVFAVLFAIALVHIALACRQEHLWRKRARWVLARSNRDRDNELESNRLDHQTRKFTHQRLMELRAMQPRPMSEDIFLEEEELHLHEQAQQKTLRSTAGFLALTTDSGAGQPIGIGAPKSGQQLALANNDSTASAAAQQLALASPMPGSSVASIGIRSAPESGITVRFVGALLGQAREDGQQGVDSHQHTPPPNSPSNVDPLASSGSDSVGGLEYGRVVFHSGSPAGTKHKVWEIGSLEREGQQGGVEFESLRRINQSIAEWVPQRPGGRTGSQQTPGDAIALRQQHASASKVDGELPGLRRLEEEPPEPMIVEKPPKGIPLSLSERFWLAVQRSKPLNVWRACLMHHKLFFLPSDTQAFIFSAPERVAVLHMSLWFNVLFLAMLLSRDTTFRPGEDPGCEQLGLMAWNCIGYRPAVTVTFISALLTFVVSNVFMILSRGRSFPARTRGFSEDDREKAFVHHMMGLYPMCWHEPEQVVLGVRAWWARLTGQPCAERTPKHDHPLIWQPSVVFIAFLILTPVAAYILLYSMFFYSASRIMEEVTYSDREGYVELIPPPLERPEFDAASNGNWLQGSRVMLPHLQRYVALLSVAWCFHLFLLEPLAFQVHLFIGEPSLEWLLQTGTRSAKYLRSCLRCMCCIRCGRRSAEKVAPLPHQSPARAQHLQENELEVGEEMDGDVDDDASGDADSTEFLPGQLAH